MQFRIEEDGVDPAAVLPVSALGFEQEMQSHDATGLVRPAGVVEEERGSVGHEQLDGLDVARGQQRDRAVRILNPVQREAVSARVRPVLQQQLNHVGETLKSGRVQHRDFPAAAIDGRSVSEEAPRRLRVISLHGQVQRGDLEVLVFIRTHVVLEAVLHRDALAVARGELQRVELVEAAGLEDVRAVFEQDLDVVAQPVHVAPLVVADGEVQREVPGGVAHVDPRAVLEQPPHDAVDGGAVVAGRRRPADHVERVAPLHGGVERRAVRRVHLVRVGAVAQQQLDHVEALVVAGDVERRPAPHVRHVRVRACETTEKRSVFQSENIRCCITQEMKLQLH